LEGPLSVRGEPLSKRFVFRTHPRHAAGLAWAGFDLLSLASNHLLDFGEQGLIETVEGLGEGGVAYVGAGRSYQEAHRPLLWEAKGRRVAFLAYAATRWKGSPEVPSSELVSFAELATVRDEVQRARELADLVVVILHLGTEYQIAPDEEQVAASRAAIDAGACLVVGHHSHVVQGAETYRNGLIVYGLGDFVFDIDVVEAAREGAILRVLLGERGVEAADLLAVRIVDDVQPQLMVDGGGRPIVRQVYRRS
jgi:poly-gamma-glutamate capsule biosynthesis protein CapA/YwtB (metallophosphatase superfamily)